MNPRHSNARRRLAAGLITGALIGGWTAWQVRKVQVSDAPGQMVDWERVRSIATSMNRSVRLNAPSRVHLDREYRALVRQTIPLISSYTGMRLPHDLDQIYAFDRVDWIEANIDAFKIMFDPIERLGGQGMLPGRLGDLWSGINQTVLSAEIGFLLGYLARRVLGQYDLALLGREPLASSGKLYFVQPNIAGVERSLGVPPVQFRLWLALHETTHAFEFECNPWVRDAMNEMLQRYFSLLTEDVEYLKRGAEALRMFWERARASAAESGAWIELVMSPEQRRLFAEMQAMMAVIEGYSNHVMNAVGRHLMPDYELIHRRFELRQSQRSPAEQLFARLTGLDIKLEQYRLGESFIDRVVELRGHDFARRVWDRRANLPTLEELRSPEQWIRRIDAQDSTPRLSIVGGNG
ncbi:MAG TPA: zinc-dependent metalloprotease [Thermomicrobiales bacterium]|nr:zinc-dependent metalloprotease [Thermomicrobiales bacterium]